MRIFSRWNWPSNCKRHAWVGLLLLVYFPCHASFAATIRGHVQAVPKVPLQDESTSDGKYESRKFKFIERVNYDELRDFVVSIDNLTMTNRSAGNPNPIATIYQKDAAFVPHVLPIIAGTTVEWPNQDEIFHNVFSYSEAKQFDLGLYKKEKVPPVTFTQPGRVDVFCSIHSKMHAIILVLPNPFFARSDSRGNFEIRDVPPGKYRLKAWHERMPPEIKDVTVPASGEIRVDFKLGIKGLPQY